jgi:Integrase core domain
MSSTPPTRPFERLSVDLIKLPRSKLGNEYAVVFIDSFTRWPEVILVPDKKATTIIRVMKEYIFVRHGLPNYLLSDEGSEFFNQLVAEVCKLYGVTKVFSAAYHSRGHGMVERLNRTIEDCLKHTTNQACDDWDVWLPEALFAIRSTPASGTKMSPFRLLYRRDPILPIDNAHLYPQSSSSMAQAEAYCVITHAADYTGAASNMARYHSRTQEHLNTSRTPASLSKGNLVYAHKPDAKRGKIAHTWRGPYMIVGCHSGNNNYTLQTFNDQKVQRTTRNINDLRPFLDTDDSDKVDTSDVLPFPQLLPSLIPTSGGDTTTARKPRGRGRPLGSKNKEDRSARRTKRRRQHVVQSQAFRETLNANRLWLEQPSIRYFF